ncbi:hypothetical protein [Clostridium tarantellae]|uniref:Uncharacterized protein n=1 Tax=Clostridium tarantellae TaxID=39493 RepID=A0A6I1MJ78_9CLOT|nr:hypothetical protein [Clostridium tarantellae]MPQ42207.1 hypothetical protein [Clostridium tarantellae]
MAHSKLYRSFIILQESERGHSVSKDKPLSGYAKVEAKNNKCRIAFYAQNLKSDYEKCNMMVICNRKDLKQNINIGEVNITSQGKVDFNIEFDSDNIGETGIDYEKLVGAALYKEIGGSPVFFMYGFLNGEQPKDNWKEYKISNCDERSNHKKNEEKKLEMKKVEHSKTKIDIDINENKHKDENVEKIEKSNNINSDVEKDVQYRQVEKNIETKFDDYENKIEEYKREKEQETQSEDLNKNVSSKNDNEFEDDNSFELRGGMGDFFSSVVTGLQEIKGFAEDIKNCKWYKVPVNDFEEMCNMSNYNKYTVAYYPMINYYPYISQYGYFMIGFKVDSNGEVKYVVYAIPGGKDKRDQPYCGRTGFVTWVPNDSSEMKGHWVMFYDFQNSMVVVPMK